MNLIVIATRHDSHADYVVRAIEAGKAVYVEKPPAMTIEELDRIKAAYDRQVAQGGAPFLMVGYNRRFSPLAVTLRQIFAKRADPLAMVYRINAGAVAAAEWVQDTRVGGGRLVGECGHFVDLLTFLNGSEPVTVSGAAIGTPEDRKPDVLTMTLEFANGSLGTIHYFSNGHPGLPKEHIEVFGGGIAAQLLELQDAEGLWSTGRRPDPGTSIRPRDFRRRRARSSARCAPARAHRFPSRHSTVRPAQPSRPSGR